MSAGANKSVQVGYFFAPGTGRNRSVWVGGHAMRERNSSPYSMEFGDHHITLIVKTRQC